MGPACRVTVRPRNRMMPCTDTPEFTWISWARAPCFGSGMVIAMTCSSFATSDAHQGGHMKRELTFGAIGLLFLAACNRSPAKEQEQARNAQQQADEKSAQYRMQAEEKSAEEQA